MWLRPTTGATGGCTGRVRDVCIGSPLALTARAFLGDGSGTGWPEGRLAGLAGGAGSPGCGWLGRPPASLRVRRTGGAGRGDEGWGGGGDMRVALLLFAIRQFVCCPRPTCIRAARLPPFLNSLLAPCSALPLRSPAFKNPRSPVHYPSVEKNRLSHFG